MKIAAVLCMTTLAFAHARPSCAQSVPTVTVGHKDIDGSRLATGRWRVQFARVVDGKEQVQPGYFWDVARAGKGEEARIISVQWSDAPDGGHDSTFVDARTLQPRRFHGVNPSDDTSVEFAGTAYKARKSPKGGSVESDEGTLDTAAFDETVSDLVIGALPLSPGYKASIPFALAPVLFRSHGKTDRREVAVLGEGSTQGRPVWLVDVTDPRGVRHLMYDKETRALLDARFQIPAMGGRPAAELHMTRTPVH